MKILINDGLHKAGIELLEKAGYTVDTNSITQIDLVGKLNEYDAIIVRSATQVRTELIEASPNLKVIGRGGVGLDNIDVDFAKSKNIAVLNTPAASSRSVAELAMAHLFGIVRSLPAVNKAMSLDGVSDFGALKKSASKGIELQGKKLGLIGFGRIGRATASIALGCGMEILAYDPFLTAGDVTLDLHPVYNHEFTINVKTVSKEELLANADFISLHIPGGQGYVLDTPEFAQMKDGVGVVNCARGGTINEAALLGAIKSGKVKYAATDVFEKEPPVNTDILRMNAVGLSPHIGASTEEAQERVGVELAQNIINFFNS
ncbi:MAG: D-2-hydroxyacid dehydrogenase [Bacteroidetes bacterium]|jgi:D-3-phosphoglycerate dehydrogenase / 2-oxoglutarate reductase|nr:D-2-hydroxyacid dehydrogenase [Bacteroidota bacterium]